MQVTEAAPDLERSAPWLADVSPGELRRIIDALYRVHQFIPAISDLDTLLERIIQVSKDLACAEAGSLLLYDAAADELYFHVAIGETGDQQTLKRKVRLKPNQGIAGIAATTRKIVNVDDAQNDPRLYRLADATIRFETRTLLAVPLVDRDRLVGILEVVNKLDGGAFSTTDIHVMEMFSAIAATAIVNARLIEENLRAERMAAIGEAVAGLSHYTKNLITGLSAGTDLIDEGLQRNCIDVLQRSWPVFRRNTRRIAHFVEDMLAFSKPRTPFLADCNVHELVDEVAQTFWSLLAKKQIALDLDLDDAPDTIRIDQRGIFRCLLNLLTNAADAAPNASGRIRISVDAGPGGEAVIRVADNGSGVPEDLRRKVFEPFFSTKGSRGTGLGLAVTRKIVQEHGGRIEVGTSDEGGAEFIVYLPQPQPDKEG